MNWQERAEKAEAELVKWRTACHAGKAQVEGLQATLAKAREQKPLTWGTSGELMDILKNPIYSAPAPVPAVAEPAEWREAMQEAHDTFQRYADLHRAKDTPDGHEKAKANQKLANKLYALLQSAPQLPGVAAPAVPEEWLKCWLIERPASSEWPAIWLTLTTDGRRWASDGGTMYATGGDWCFTSAASEALKFAEKESADEYVRHNKIKDVVVTEHIFDNRALLQSAPQSDKEVRHD